MQYLTTKDGSPAEYSLAQLRADHPTVSFPDTFPLGLLATYDVFAYDMDPVPDNDARFQRIAPGDFYQDGATWKRQWVLTSFVPGEISKVQLIRAMRETTLPSGANAWVAAKAVLDGAGTDIQEDWGAITRVPRGDTTFLALAEQIRLSEGLTEQEMSDLLDGAFQLGVTK